jgi:gliding motility-associated-like protein
VKGCRNWGVTEVKTEIRAYNLVTRNTDGKNDAFVVDCISRFPNNNVKIFNRAGVKVYEADGYDNNEKVFRGFGERGVYAAGNDLPVGTYFYIIDKRDGSKPKTGYLELVK